MSTFNIVCNIIGVIIGLYCLLRALGIYGHITIKSEAFGQQVRLLIQAGLLERAIKLSKVVTTPLTQATGLMLTAYDHEMLNDIYMINANRIDAMIASVKKSHLLFIGITTMITTLFAIQVFVLNQRDGWFIGLGITSIVLFAFATTFWGKTSVNLAGAKVELGRLRTAIQETLVSTDG